jgi:tungstate transport system permease protein
MSDIQTAFLQSIKLIAGSDAQLLQIVALSLRVSFGAVVLATMCALPAGALLAIGRFPGRRSLVVAFNSMMGLPPVVIGLMVYLLLSRSGPLGSFGLLFTPAAMVVAQALLVAPIIAALTRQIIVDLWAEYRDELTAWNVSPARRVTTLLWDARFGLLTVILAGFGRAAADVGAVMIVGGNIDGVTRTMTTALALETSKGNLALALGLGAVLIAVVTAVNTAAWGLRRVAEARAG